MRPLTACVLLSVLPGGVALSTEYKTERALRMEIESSLKMETTSMEISRDGEPQTNPGGGFASETHHKEVHVDKVLEVKEGKPTKIRRSFESLSGKVNSTMGDNSNETEIDCPLDGVTLEIRRDDDGKIDVGAVEGKTPDGKALENHLPQNFLDALLPEGEMKIDSTWELDSDAVKRALRLDVAEALYPRPERPEGAEGEGRGRGRRGMRGTANFLSQAEWKGKAKLVATDKEVDGHACAVIDLKIHASGDLPEPEPGSGRGNRAFEPAASAGFAARSTYDVSLEGQLVFSLQSKHPVSLELEGSAKTETERETKREDHTTKFHVVMEGVIAYKVAVSEESAKSEK